MTGADLRLQTLRKAAAAFRSTPGRRGRVVELQGAAEVLVAGDMHGHVENFRRLLLLADLARHPRRHLVVQELIHGPFEYPTGGDKSHQLLDLVCALKCQFSDRVHFLIGNHELAQATDRPISKADVDLNDHFVQGVRSAYGPRADEVCAAYRELFAAAPLAVRTAGRAFLSHSLPSAARMDDFALDALLADPSRDGDLAPGGAIFALVWGRDVRPENAEAFLALVDADLLITGHVPCEAGFERPSPRHLILDSQGASAGACLLPADRPVSPKELTACVRLL
jgi:hypothetical protein